MSRLLGLDVGTSSTKVVVIDEHGRVHATADAPHVTLTPKPGWTEQEPETWWEAACSAIREGMSRAGCRGDDITAIGLSGQMHGSVFLPTDADPTTTRALRPALLWNDQRTASQCRAIEQAAGGREPLVHLTGNPALTGLTAPKILWVREHEPAVFARVGCVVNPKDFVRFRLTGALATDVGDGSGFGLMDIRSRSWSEALIEALDLDPSILPPILESSSVAGEVTAWAAARTGLRAGTPVVAGSGDQMTGAVGSGIVQSGCVSATLGTSGVVLAHLGATLAERLPLTLQTMMSAVAGEWCTYGCTLSAAGALQWYRDTLASGTSFRRLDEEAAGVPAGADGLLFLPSLTGERCPHADPNARGAWIGLTANHTRAHLTRAVMEGVALTMTTMLDLIRGMGSRPTEVRLAGGGAASDLWCRIMAGTFNCPVVRMETVEGSAFGAALLAGVGVNAWSSVAEACRSCIHPLDRIEPDPAEARRYQTLRPLFDGLHGGLQGVMHELHRFQQHEKQGGAG